MVQQPFAIKMSILVKTIESRLGNGNEAFYCRKYGKYTNLLVHTIVRWLSKVNVVERIWSLRKNLGIFLNVKKSEA